MIPKDKELDTSCSPGVRRLMGHVGGKEAFEEGRQDLEELAGILVKTKQVERVSSVWASKSKPEQCALGGIRIGARQVHRYDGTGVPVVPRETIGSKTASSSDVSSLKQASTASSAMKNPRPM